MRNFFVALVVFIIVIVGLGTLVSKFFSRGEPAKPPGQATSQQKFSERATKVRFITDGSIVGPEAHRSIRITVDQTERKLEVLKGYNEEVIRTQSFANDSAAFTRFLIGLNSLGFTKENPEISKDERGVCPLGVRYIYEASYMSGEPFRSWSASCGGTSRSQANIGSIQQLMRNQIPNYNKLVSDVNLMRP